MFYSFQREITVETVGEEVREGFKVRKKGREFYLFFLTLMPSHFEAIAIFFSMFCSFKKCCPL